MSSFFDWKYWSVINSTIPIKKDKKGIIRREGERWHLWNLHSPFIFQETIEELSKACHQRYNSGTLITASTTWTDVRPQAHWCLNPANHKEEKNWKNTELADLLVVINNKIDNKQLRRAMLLQAKWTDSVINLDKDSITPGAISSSNKERDFLESQINDFFVYKFKKRAPLSGIPISCNNYSLQKNGNLKDHKEFSRYLLFSKHMDMNYKPYQTLSPKNRTSISGKNQTYQDLLLDMAAPIIGSHIPLADQSNKTWSRLVDSILDWSKKGHEPKKITRFTSISNLTNVYSPQITSHFLNFMVEHRKKNKTENSIQKDINYNHGGFDRFHNGMIIVEVDITHNLSEPYQEDFIKKS